MAVSSISSVTGNALAQISVGSEFDIHKPHVRRQLLMG